MSNNNDKSSPNHVTLNLYNIFLAVAQTKSLSAASKRLFISQPAISKAIKQLENELGTALFFRSSKGVQLTDDGELLYSHVFNAINEINIGEQLAHVLAGSVLERSGLDDGDLAGFDVAGGVAALHADGITVHCNILLYWVCLYSTIPRRSMSLLRGIDSLNFIPCRKQKLTFSAAYRSWSPRRYRQSGTPAP